MNIITLDYDPIKNAEYHCDQWLNKMILESAQMLSTAHDMAGSWLPTMYKPTHKGHSVTKWVAQSQQNYKTTLDYLWALLHEYYYRRDKDHKTTNVLEPLKKIPKLPRIQQDTTYPKTFRKGFEACYNVGDVVQAYRLYARMTNAEWGSRWRNMQWTNRPVPSFMEEVDGRCPVCRQRDSHAGEREVGDGSVVVWHCNVPGCSNHEDNATKGDR